jgi:hypothetical protein
MHKHLAWTASHVSRMSPKRTMPAEGKLPLLPPAIACAMAEGGLHGCGQPSERRAEARAAWRVCNLTWEVLT